MELPRTPSGHDAVLFIVDRISKAVRFCPTTTAVYSVGSAKLLFKEWYRLYGLPRKIMSDRDGRSINKFWQELFHKTQVKLAMSSSHHPQTDGQTERMNPTMEEMLRHYVSYRQNNWDEALPALEHAYNNSVNATINQEPFVMSYGQKPLDFKDLLLGKTSTPVESVKEFVSRMERLFADASTAI
jgi:transposase InsO family protein